MSHTPPSGSKASALERSPFFHPGEHAEPSERINFDIPREQGWVVKRNGIWTYSAPQGAELPEQGWKIHISSTVESASAVLARVASVAHANITAFKHLAGPREFRNANAKYSARSSAGKFITLYPHHAEQFSQLLLTLEDALIGFDGPHILSDFKFNKAPVFFRYGAFKAIVGTGQNGSAVLCIRDHKGRLVEDKRDVIPSIPEFVTVPRIVHRSIQARLSDGEGALERAISGWNISRAMHFNNGGGVYELSSNSTDAKLVMKEGRPYAGIDFRDRDARDRILEEFAALTIVQNAGVYPRPHSLTIVDGHALLLMESIPGPTLHNWIARNYPFSYDLSVGEYQKSALNILTQVCASLKQVHKCGIAAMDLHPHNIIVSPNAEVRFVDLEASAPVDAANGARNLGAPGYVPNFPHSARERDRYALEQVAYALFYPLGPLADISHQVRDGVRQLIGETFGPGLVARIDEMVAPFGDLQLVNARTELSPLQLQEAKKLVPMLREGIKHRGKLRWRFPRMDPTSNGQMGDVASEYSIETGLAGTLLALGPDGDPGGFYLRALERGYRDHRLRASGLLDGSLGVAVLLAARGARPNVDQFCDAQPSTAGVEANVSLRSGSAGRAVGLLRLARLLGSESLEDQARITLNSLTNHIDSAESERRKQWSSVGLIDGWSGVSLALTMAGFHFKESKFFVAARRALSLDEQRLVEAKDGSLQVLHGSKLLPYLEGGSAGIGLALSALPLAMRRPGDDETIRGIARACRARACISGGLYGGRAGLVLARAHLQANERAEMHILMEQKRLLVPFLFKSRSFPGLAAVGQDNRALSDSLATGTAGYLLALQPISGLRELFGDLEEWQPRKPTAKVERREVINYVDSRSSGSQFG